MKITITLLALLTIIAFVPALLAAGARTDVADLTAAFLAGGVTVDRLLVYRVGDIVLIRGRTADPAAATAAVELAAALGYTRVANLVDVVPAIGDEGIERVARIRLDMSRALVGCSFEVRSTGGVVLLQGRVADEIQKGYAIRLIGRIDGVKGVQSLLMSPSL